MKGIDTYFAYLEHQPIIPRDKKALTLCYHRQLLHIFDTTHVINIFTVPATISSYIPMPCWVVAATDKQTQTYVSLLSRKRYYRPKYIFIEEDVCGNLLGLGVNNINKFKSENTEKFTNY